MLVGHFAAATIAKTAAPKTSLGTLTAAAMLPDLLSFAFITAGLEHWRAIPGGRGINGLDLYDIALSHSLVMDVAWSALFSFVFSWRKHYKVGALAIFVAVTSHWALDFIAHRPDMPIAPGLSARLGLGLWTSVPATLAVEGGIWIVALVIYLGRTSAKSRVGIFGFWPVIVLLTLSWISNITAAAPPAATSATAGAIVSLIFFGLIVAWPYWMNGARVWVSDSDLGKSATSA